MIRAQISDNKITDLTSSLQRDAHWIDHLRFQFIAFPVGYIHIFDRNISIIDALEKGQITIGEKPDGNGKLKELVSTTEDAEISITYQTAPDFCINQISFKRTKSILPYDTSASSVTVTKRSDNGVPMEYVLLQIIEAGERGGLKTPQKHASTTVKIIDIKQNVNLKLSDFAFSVPIKNGTSVFMQDAPQIKYVWFDGKAEPATDELMLRIARGGHRFMPGIREPRFWFIAVGAILIILGIALKAKTILKQRQEK